MSQNQDKGILMMLDNIMEINKSISKKLDVMYGVKNDTELEVDSFMFEFFKLTLYAHARSIKDVIVNKVRDGKMSEFIKNHRELFVQAGYDVRENEYVYTLSWYE